MCSASWHSSGFGQETSNGKLPLLYCGTFNLWPLSLWCGLLLQILASCQVDNGRSKGVICQINTWKFVKKPKFASNWCLKLTALSYFHSSFVKHARFSGHPVLVTVTCATTVFLSLTTIVYGSALALASATISKSHSYNSLVYFFGSCSIFHWWLYSQLP